MVNFGLNSASILGICLAVAGAALYFIRSVRPELARDHDIFFAAVGILCGFILLFQGWRLDPILQFGQLLLTGSTIFFAIESIRLRGITAEQAKRNTRIVDEERPVSRVYRTTQEAQLYDELPEEEEEEFTRPRIRPSRDTRSNRVDEYEEDTPRSSRYRTDDYSENTSRRSSRTSNGRAASSQTDRRRRPSRSVARSTQGPEDEWDSPRQVEDDWDVPESQANRSSRSSVNGPRSTTTSQETPRPRKKSRSPNSVTQRQESESSTEYVDYQPVDQPQESDNSANFDDF